MIAEMCAYTRKHIKTDLGDETEPRERLRGYKPREISSTHALQKGGARGQTQLIFLNKGILSLVKTERNEICDVRSHNISCNETFSIVIRRTIDDPPWRE